MQYDPIKRGLGNLFNRTPFLRKLFYRMLDLLLLRAWHIRKELRIIQKQVEKVGDILDAGSGFGQYTWFMSGLFRQCKITGMDVKDEQISDCNAFFHKAGLGERVHFVVGDLTSYSEKAKYDLILCVDVMEHILEDTEVFKNFAISLKPGGVVLISTPSDQGGSDVHNMEDTSFIEEHVRNGYNRMEITDKLRSAGFSQVITRYSYGRPGRISWYISMKYPVTLLNLTRIFYVLLPFYYLCTFPFCLILNFLDLRIEHNKGTGLIVKALL